MGQLRCRRPVSCIFSSNQQTAALAFFFPGLIGPRNRGHCVPLNYLPLDTCGLWPLGFGLWDRHKRGALTRSTRGKFKRGRPIVAKLGATATHGAAAWAWGNRRTAYPSRSRTGTSQRFKELPSSSSVLAVGAIGDLSYGGLPRFLH